MTVVLVVVLCPAASKLLVLINVKVVILGISKGLSVLVTVIVGAGLVTVTGGIVVMEGVIVVVEMVVEVGRVVLRFKVVVDRRVVVCVKVDVVVKMEVIVAGCKNCCWGNGGGAAIGIGSVFQRATTVYMKRTLDSKSKTRIRRMTRGVGM
jgi:hypothetical protein